MKSPRILALLAGLLSLAAQAQQGANGAASVNGYLSKMDLDRDGRVSLAEYQDWLGYAFQAMDRDRNGVLTAAEQPGGRGQPLALAEHRARIAERFRRQDTNRDGYLSARELAAPPR